jgi:hypothetical protein
MYKSSVDRCFVRLSQDCIDVSELQAGSGSCVDREGVTGPAGAEHHGVFLTPTLLTFATAVNVVDIYSLDLLTRLEVTEGAETIVTICGNPVLPPSVFQQILLAIYLAFDPSLFRWLGCRLHSSSGGFSFLKIGMLSYSSSVAFLRTVAL